MEGNHCFRTPLAQMDFDLSVDGVWAIERDIAARLGAGRGHEVMDYLAQCDIELLRSLARLGGERAIWQRDGALWLALTRITALRKVIFTAPPQAVLRRDAAFSAAMRAIGEQCMQNADACAFVLHEIVDLLPYPGMPLDEVLDLLDSILTLRRLNGIPDEKVYRHGSAGLIACLVSTADLITAAAKAPCFCEEALDAHAERTSVLPAGQRWLPWHDFFAQYPDLYDRVHPQVPDAALILRRWPQASPGLRKALAATLLGAIQDDASGDALAAVDRLITSDETLFATLLCEQSALFGPSLAGLIREKRYPALFPLLFALMTQSRRAIDTYQDILRAILAGQPTLLLTAAPGKLDLLIPLLSTSQLRAMLPQLGAMIAKTTSKAVRDALVAACAHLELDEIRAAGWLDVRNKNLRLACRDILLAHPNQAGATPLLAAMLAAGALDPASASSLAAALAPTDAAAAPSLAALEAQAAAITRCSAAIKPLDHAPVLALFQPLSEHAARAALHLAATGDEALPPLASALMAQLSRGQRARLALHATQTWINNDGEPKLRWMLRLLATGADDRIAEPLGAAVFAWGKKSRYPRAIVALAQLSALDTPYALLRVMEAAESIKLKGPVIHAAVKALDAAAQRRSFTMGELIDELTPDFGLAGGLTLTTGALSYGVALQDDLSLRLVDAKGKRLKSLPANKDDNTLEAWQAAASRFATLAAAVKTSARLQVPRLMSALITGKSWETQRWTQLFLDHPLLRIIGRSLVWQAEGAASFRIAEDFSLIEADDEPFHLAPDARIALWHPAGAGSGEAEAWRAHLADYQLTPIIDQTGAPAALPPAALLTAERLLAPVALRVAHEDLDAILTSLGYRPGPRGGQNPAWIDWHAWPLPTAALEVRIVNGACPSFPSFNTPVGVASLEMRAAAREYALVPTASWPLSLLATAWSHLLLLDAKRLA
ncbi:DUF4132 domain-containing protein [Massilia violaceinigra]|uniref:DUF4132 domain-containing protein n=1 Tax=Massilia violaceinigra TaxID=2045208 RepID=A0ABY4A340_9BURK|nr:DUF4132 domain-containing protein [Massilia violaceinigra]UOD29170.1 DUF4132 domain-containing protein [Massilia violaceinigra]